MYSNSFISAAPKDLKYKFSYVKLALKFVKGRIKKDSSFIYWLVFWSAQQFPKHSAQ